MKNNAGIRVRPEGPVGSGDGRGEVTLARLCHLLLEESESSRVDALGARVREALLEERQLVETLAETPTIGALHAAHANSYSSRNINQRAPMAFGQWTLERTGGNP